MKTIPDGWKPTATEVRDAISGVAQAAINIDSGLTTIEQGSRCHKSMHRLCHLFTYHPELVRDALGMKPLV